MAVAAGKSEVVRYTAREPKAWIERGMLLRVINRTSTGTVRVTAARPADGQVGGSPQYVDESDVEPVGVFEKNSRIFGAGIEEEAAALEAAIAQLGSSVTIHRMQSFYPAGDEQTMVYELTGRVVPPAGIPAADWRMSARNCSSMRRPSII